MSSETKRLRRLLTFLMEAPAAAWLVTAVYLAFGFFFVVTEYTLNDEGLLTYYWAGWARRDFVPTFFLQKVKPVLTLLYAPVSGAGAVPTLLAHVIVAAAAIPMIAATARALGQRLPNLPPLLLALSPVYFYGGAAGFSNVDGVAGMSLVLYLWCARRTPLLAGLVAGTLPWVRFELVLFAVVMAVYALITKRERAFLVGLVVFPLLYIGAGTVYHKDFLWVARFPPSAPFDPDNPFFHDQPIGVRYFLEPAAAVTPAAALAAALGRTRLQRIEWALVAYVVITAVMMDVLQIFHLGNFAAAPRYLLHLLPALPLLAARAVEPWCEGREPRKLALFTFVVAGVWIATRQLDARSVYFLIAAYATIALAAWSRVGTMVLALVVALAVAGPLLPLRIDVGRAADTKWLDPLAGWLLQHPEKVQQPIYTNAQLLAPYLEKRLPDAEIYHVAGIDMVREMVLLSNPDNGQRDRIRKLCRTSLYGQTLLAPISPDDIPSDALFALRKGARLPRLFPPAIWASRLQVLAETPEFVMAQFRRVPG